MFPDFKKYSIIQYEEIFKEFYSTRDESILPDGLVLDHKWSGQNLGVYLQYDDGTVRLFENGDFVVAPNSTKMQSLYMAKRAGEWSLCTPSGGISNSKSKGTKQKNIILNGVHYSRQGDRVSVANPYKYNYFERYTKKHIMRSLFSRTGNHKDPIGQVAIYEKVRKKDKSVMNSQIVVDRTPIFQEIVRVELSESDTKGVIDCIVRIGYGKEDKFTLKLPDANIVHLFNPEYMWNFDMNADQRVFNAVESIRKYAPEKLKELGCPQSAIAIENFNRADNMEM